MSRLRTYRIVAYNPGGRDQEFTVEAENEGEARNQARDLFLLPTARIISVTDTTPALKEAELPLAVQGIDAAHWLRVRQLCRQALDGDIGYRTALEEILARAQDSLQDGR